LFYFAYFCYLIIFKILKESIHVGLQFLNNTTNLMGDLSPVA